MRLEKYGFTLAMKALLTCFQTSNSVNREEKSQGSGKMVPPNAKVVHSNEIFQPSLNHC
ncbi:hypothetical protein SOVF_084610 [Spinacia oleracea]|nr:hypothetical protein SOVF_084610 [Spinacia oleracea]